MNRSSGETAIGRTAERYTFYYHEHVGRRLASEVCLRLRLSNEERERVEWLVEKHQYLCDVKAMKWSKLKPVLAHPGIRELLALHRADALASERSVEHVEYCEKLLQEWTAGQRDQAPATASPAPGAVMPLDLPAPPAPEAQEVKEPTAQPEVKVAT